ncbi:hypothetical protein BaRGS_00037600, partial [Batillaria attramentaria]
TLSQSKYWQSSRTKLQTKQNWQTTGSQGKQSGPGAPKASSSRAVGPSLYLQIDRTVQFWKPANRPTNDDNNTATVTVAGDEVAACLPCVVGFLAGVVRFLQQRAWVG